MKEFKFSFSHGLSALSTLPEPFKPALPTEELDTPFKKMYPPEALGEELTDNARVWKVYRDEATKADAVMLDGWNKTLDILLVFAGLFSAVVTSFVGQSNTQLQPDSNAYVANALLHLVKSSGGVDTLPPPPSLNADPSSTVLWVNALWFMSLLLSLAVAFLCILAKQWIGEYVVRTTSTSTGSHDWSRRRAFYFRGIKAWGLPGFLSFLPVLLHISLFLFIAGLCLSMWAVSRTIALCLIPIGGCLAVFYIIATLVPFWRPDCPTALPLIAQLRAALRGVLRTSLAICIHYFPAVHKAFQMLRRCILWPVYDACIVILAILPNVLCRRNVSLAFHSSDNATPFHLNFFDEEHFVSSFGDTAPRGLFALQETLLSLRKKTLRDAYWRRNKAANDAEALRWLILDCSNHNVVAVGYQALGSVVHDSSLANHINIDDTVRNAISFERACTFTHTPTRRSTTEIMRVLRSILFICPPVSIHHFRNSYASRMLPLQSVKYPDMALVLPFLDLDSDWSREELEKATLPFSDLAPSPTFQSTLVLLFRIPLLSLPAFLKLLLNASEDTLTRNFAFIAGRLCGGRRSCHHPPFRCPAPLQCLSEALCAGLKFSTSDMELRAELVLRLQWFSFRRNPGRLSRPSLFTKPHLLSSFASETFIGSLSTVKHIAALVHEPVHWIFTDLAHCITAITVFARLCRQLASNGRQDKALAPELKNMIDHLLIYVVFHASNSHPNWGLEFVPPAQEMFCRRGGPRYADFVARAPWANIFALLPWASSHRLEIACFTIGALCSRGRNPGAGIDQLGLTELDHSLVHLLQDGQSAEEGRELLRDFARHRIQLGGDGWASDTDALEAGGVAYIAGEITRDVLVLGPCAECSGHTGHLRRERETEIYLIDRCQRLGVRFDVRYDADPDLQLLIELNVLGGMVDAV